MNSKKTTKQGIKYHITEEGSLGLLALGDVGLREWRKVKNKRSKKANEK